MQVFGSKDPAALLTDIKQRVEVHRQIRQLAESQAVVVEEYWRRQGRPDRYTPTLVKLAKQTEQHALTECQASALCKLASRSVTDMPNSMQKELADNSLKLLVLAQHPQALRPLLFNVDAVRDPAAMLLGIGAEPSGLSIRYASVGSLLELFAETAPEAIFDHILEIAPSACDRGTPTLDPKRIELLAYTALGTEGLRRYRSSKERPKEVDRGRLIQDFRQRATKTLGSQDQWGKDTLLFIGFLESIHPHAYDIHFERPGAAKRLGLPEPKKSYLFPIKPQ